MPAKSVKELSPFPQGAGVLVTGCSSGIGRAVATYLARQGFTVFATVRRPEDAAALSALGHANLIPFAPLDLAQRRGIPALSRFVEAELARRGLTGLYALVNNAGGGSIAPLELMDLDKFDLELQARLSGPLALLQAFLPLIRRANGRVVWIVTPAIIPTPYVASIHACDFAANCLARTLNLELRPWNIPNIMVRCGGIDTPAPARNDRELQESLNTWSPEQRGLYFTALQNLKREFAAFDARRTPPEAVARVVCQALTARRPRLRYQVGYLSHLAALLEALPQSLADNLLALRG